MLVEQLHLLLLDSGCRLQFVLRAAGMEKVKAVEDTVLCSLGHFYKTFRSQLVGRGRRKHSYKYNSGLMDAAVSSPLAEVT